MDKACTPDFWPSKMMRDGATATAEQMATAWKNWKGGPYLSLVSELEKAGVTSTNSTYPLHRLADGMLQRARRAGVARYESGQWILSQRGG